MTYSVTDITELIRHHLVFSEPDETRVKDNLRQLIAGIEEMAPGSMHTEALWLFCDRCGASVDMDVLAVDGSNFTSGGGFYCSDCIPGRDFDSG